MLICLIIIKKVADKMSKTKNTILKILKQQIDELQKGVAQMDEDSLLKQVAKQKIIYSLTKKQNALDLVYSCIALAQFYIQNDLFEAAIKILNEANDIKQTGDATYMIGIVLYKTKKQSEAYRLFQNCISLEWIEPSITHQQSNQLEAISSMQKIEYDKYLKNSERKDEIQKKLVELCYEKIKIIKKYNLSQSENYFYGLAMGDLAEVYLKFKQYQAASQKIKSAIKIMKGQKLGTEKLIEFYSISAKIGDFQNQPSQCLSDLKNAIELIDMKKGKQKQAIKFGKDYEDIYYLYIKRTLNV